MSVKPVIHFTELYSVIDHKTRSVVALFTAINDEMAIRSFEDLFFRIEDNVYNQHPEDFSLQGGFRFGVDPATGNTVCEGSLHIIVSGSTYSRAIIDSKRLERAAYYKKLEDLRSSGNLVAEVPPMSTDPEEVVI